MNAIEVWKAEENYIRRRSWSINDRISKKAYNNIRDFFSWLSEEEIITQDWEVVPEKKKKVEVATEVKVSACNSGSVFFASKEGILHCNDDGILQNGRKFTRVTFESED